MEPLAAVGLASNIIQIVEFAGKIVSRSQEIYHSPDGISTSHNILQEAGRNLSELLELLHEHSEQRTDRKIDQSSRLFSERKGQGSSQNSTGFFAAERADEELHRLTSRTTEVTRKLRDAIYVIQVQGGNSAWQSIYQALRSVWSQNDIAMIEHELDYIRKQVDTALLISLRHRIDQFPGRAEERHHEVLKAISQTDRQSPNQEEMSEIFNYMRYTAKVDSTLRFSRIIYARLHFAELPDRIESIPKAYQDTFSWIYDPPEMHTSDATWDDFTDWLQRSHDASIYWITGKPGSGKSTLMKYLHNQSRTHNSLKRWHRRSPLVRAGFFFWNSGTAMQMSRNGLLQTLLFESLQQLCLEQTDPKLFQSLFEERWKQFKSFGGGRGPFAWAELRRVFEKLISNEKIRFFFLIDGLDEFDGDLNEVVELIMHTSERSNVKICAASRPWLVFEEAFEGKPNLLLEQLTRGDIQHYVFSKFKLSTQYCRLEKREPILSQQLLQNVVHKATGVFLWVYLVVDSLIEGLTNADRMSDLQERLDALPGGLEELFDKLLGGLKPNYLRHACQLFRLVQMHNNPPALALYFADDPDVQSSLRAEIKSLSTVEVNDLVEDLRRRIVSRCKGFLEIYESPAARFKDHERWSRLLWGDKFENYSLSIRVNAARPNIQKIRYLHRTAKDFLHSDHVWNRVLNLSGSETFIPEEHWANSFLWCLKTLSPVNERGMNIYPLWDPMTRCIEYALKLERKDGIVRLTYLDEVGRAGVEARQDFWKHGVFPYQVSSKTNYQGLGVYSDPYKAFRPRLFFGIVTCLGCDGYMRIKLESMTKMEADCTRQFAFLNHQTQNYYLNPTNMPTLATMEKDPGFEQYWLTEKEQFEIARENLQDMLERRSSPWVKRLFRPVISKKTPKYI